MSDSKAVRKSQFRTCDICHIPGMNDDYYAEHMKRCHRPCDKCKGELMVVVVMALNPERELYVAAPMGLCRPCFESIGFTEVYGGRDGKEGQARR